MSLLTVSNLSVALLAVDMASTVYWPTAGITQDRGVVVGWKIEDVVVVIGIVDEWVRCIASPSKQ